MSIVTEKSYVMERRKDTALFDLIELEVKTELLGDESNIVSVAISAVHRLQANHLGDMLMNLGVEEIGSYADFEMLAGAVGTPLKRQGW